MNRVKMKNSKFSKFVWTICLLFGFSWLLYSCTEDYTLDEEEPSWLGNSIYDYLNEQGCYTYLLRIIDDPAINYGEVLRKTGSKTMFVADDAAFEEFFKSDNDWGVHSFDELSTAQKDLLLNSATIDNVYYIRMLSAMQSTWNDNSDPIDGLCMRRETSLNVEDSITFEKPEDMPNTDYWKTYREKGGMYLLKDNTTSPMVHFLQKFLDYNNIKNDDITFIMDHSTQIQDNVFEVNDAVINGVKVVEQNIKCKNGAVHKLGHVLTPLKNMAEIIRTADETQEFSKLLERFSAPYFSRMIGSDSVFVKRYFSERNQDGDNNGVVYAPADTLITGVLKFDPGWNQYTSESQDLAEDMGVMFVPSNEALIEYWEKGGAELRERYGTWDNMPNDVLDNMINNHMKNAFTGSVPSKFVEITNDAQDPMGVEEENIVKTYIGCNGIIYVTNKLFPPTAYVAVSSPALINENMKIINWAIETLEFDAYLLSMDSYYSFIIPTDSALKTYYNPVSWGKAQPEVYEFYYDNTRKSVGAYVYAYDLETGVIDRSKTIRTVATGGTDIQNKLEDILDYHIIVGDIEDGNAFHQAKGNGTIRVSGTGVGMNVDGGYQVEQGQDIKVTQIYDKTLEGNGKAYKIEDAVLEGPQKSVYKVLEEHGSYEGDPFYEWFQLLKGSPTNVSDEEWIFWKDEDFASVDYNVYYFNTYHYTIYVPTNEAVKAAIEAGLPTWEQIDTCADVTMKDSLTQVLEYCLRYHIQDNSVYIGGGDVNLSYETSAPNAATERFYKVGVRCTGGNNGEIELTDDTSVKKHVVKTNGLYNIMTRDYCFDNADIESSVDIETSSFAVVHQIDGVLEYEDGQFKRNK